MRKWAAFLVLGAVAVVAIGFGFARALIAVQEQGEADRTEALTDELAATRGALEELTRLAESYDVPVEVAEVDDVPVVVPTHDGEDGRDGRDGTDGRPPTDGEVAAAVLRYCAANNGCAGPQGPAGAPGRDGETVVGPAGQDGADGHDGVDGVLCPSGFHATIIVGGQLDGWLACAPGGG